MNTGTDRLIRAPRPHSGPGEILPYAAKWWPDHTALVTAQRRLTYRALDELSAVVASSLQAFGIGAGDIVSLYGQNSWQWIVSYHGALRAGAVVNPVNVMLTGPELEYVLADCGSKALFSGEEQTPTAATAAAAVSGLELCVTFADSPTEDVVPFRSLLDQPIRGASIDEPPNPGALCSIGYTSGTTGHPKGAMQTHQAVLLNCAYTATMHGRTHDDVVVTALPAPHVYGNVAINSTFLAGGTVVLMERFNPGEALGLIEAQDATMFEGVPTMYSMMVADAAFEDVDMTTLRVSTVGGQTLPLSVLNRWEQRTARPLLELWGMTEVAGLGATHSVFAPSCPGSIGVALPGTGLKLRALDNSGGEPPAGEPGELMVRGPLVMLGYHGKPEATAEVLQPDGWLRTGDIATVNETGHYFIVDRMKDMLISGGYNIYPAEIERVVAAHPDVAMVAVGRRPDSIRGEIAVAFVVPKSGSSPTRELILDFCKNDLAAYKRPRDVVFVDDLPKTSSGKLMRRKLATLDVEGEPS